MSAITKRRARPASGRAARANDPRVVRSRAAVLGAARELFIRHGYAGTTMEQIASLAGLTKRTVYNNHGGKDALFTQIVADVLTFAETFVRGLHEEFSARITPANLHDELHDLGRRLALGIVRPEIIALRRMLIGEARSFPTLAEEYFERAPGQVLTALGTGFAQLARRRLLRIADPRRAAAQFAYLVAGEPLDRAMLVGSVPPKVRVIACAKDGVETFLARYGTSATSRTASARSSRARAG